MRKKTVTYLKDIFIEPRKLFLFILNHIAYLFPDSLFLKIKFLLLNGERLKLNNPQTFVEKIQWLKLYDRRDEYTNMVDKIEAKKYVSEILGNEVIIPTLGVYNSVEEINFTILPKQFVIKCSHDSGGLIICKDRRKLDMEYVKKQMRKGLERNFYWRTREYPYKKVRPRIIIEEYLNSDTDCLRDYKFFCFNGKVRLCQVISDRYSDEKIDFYDLDWNRIEGLVGLNQNAKNSQEEIKCPIHYQQMIMNAEKLAKGIPFVRIDQYEVNSKVYFGEITFFPNSGFGKFYPEYWNLKIGQWLSLPLKK